MFVESFRGGHVGVLWLILSPSGFFSQKTKFMVALFMGRCPGQSRTGLPTTTIVNNCGLLFFFSEMF